MYRVLFSLCIVVMWGVDSVHALCPIRVLLVDMPLEQDITYTLRADHDSSWYVAHVQAMDKPSHRYDTPECMVTIRGGKVYLQNKRMVATAAVIRSGSGRWRFNDHTYSGDIMVVHQNGRLYLINILDLESYVLGVIRWESWPTWPLEINKVCAILARTYAVYHILQSRERAKAGKMVWYDVKATNAHQTYKGVHTAHHLQEAVDATQHQVLTFNNKPIIAMYDACCGGIVPAQLTGFDFSQSPYLARTYACTFCDTCKAFSWQVTYSPDVFKELLREYVPTLRRIKSIKHVVHDPAGRLLEAHIDDGTTIHVVPGGVLYRACKDIKSFCYSLTKQGARVVVKGVGLGHHVGLCQWGARNMVKQGYLMPAILQFYYPDTKLMRLSIKDGHAVV